MKKLILLVVIFAFFISTGQSQIKLIGVKSNQATGFIDLVKWQALDSTSLANYPTLLQGYVVASSGFDDYNGSYYLSGITPTSSGLLSFNTLTNTQAILPFGSFSNISEFDMSTGNVYTLRSDSVGYFSCNKFNVSSGTDSLLGIIDDPDILGFVLDATGFDSNNGIFYCIGAGGQGSRFLISMPVRDSVFSFSKTILQATAPSENLFSLNYDNVNNALFAINTTFDAAGKFLGSYVVEVNKNTGQITERGQLLEFPYFQMGSSSFDQNTGQLLLVAYTAGFERRMVKFDVFSNTYESGFVPDQVSEIVCDNHEFAMSHYLTGGPDIEVQLPSIVYPNPATTEITIRKNVNMASWFNVAICNLTGEVVLQTRFMNQNQGILDVSNLLPAGYLLKIETDRVTEVKKIVIRK